MAKKTGWVYLFVLVAIFGFYGVAKADLLVIGTATYGSTPYKLIYQDDGPFGPITWLDYAELDTWQNQVDWAAGLGGNLTVNLDPLYYITDIDFWTTGWRLPETVDGTYVWGYEGTTTAGYNITTSEMGFLYYVSLGNLGEYATDGTNPQTGYGLNNTDEFNNLVAYGYWSGTEHSTGSAWAFRFHSGWQGDPGKDHKGYALAVRPGEVSIVPEPTTMLLLGAGLLGLAGLGRKKFLNKD